MRVHWRTVAFFGKIRILYKCPVFAGSLLSAAPGCRLSDFSARGIVLCVSRDSAGLSLTGVCQVLRIVLQIYSWTEIAMGSDSPADGRSGVNFNVELQDSSGRLGSACQAAGSGCSKGVTRA